jgi:hypothetical protein
MGHSNIADFRIEVTAWCIRARTNEKSYANHQNETMSGAELEEENGLEASRGAEEEDDVENGEEDEEVEVASVASEDTVEPKYDKANSLSFASDCKRMEQLW